MGKISEIRSEDFDNLLSPHDHSVVWSTIEEVCLSLGKQVRFSKPYLSEVKIDWYFEGSHQLTRVDDLEESSKIELLDIYQKFKDLFLEELKKLSINRSQLNVIEKHVFTTAYGDSDLLCIIDNGKITLLVNNWGLKLRAIENPSIPPIITPEFPKTNPKVTLEVKNQLGELWEDFDFDVSVAEGATVLNNSVCTDSNGLLYLGEYLPNTSVTASFLREGENCEKQTFLTLNSDSIYPVIFRIYSDVVVTVLDEAGSVVTGYSLDCEIEEKKINIVTDENGRCLLRDLPVDALLNISRSLNPSILRSYIIPRSEGEVVIILPPNIIATIIVKDRSSDNMIPNYKLSSSYSSLEKDYNKVDVLSDNDGKVILNDLIEDSEIVCFDSNSKTNQEFKVVGTDNVFTFFVDIPKVKKHTLKLLDHKNRPMKNLDIEVVVSNNTFSKTTNGNGVIEFEEGEVTNDDVVRVKAQVDKKMKYYKLKVI